MPEPGEVTLTPSGIQMRSQRFASLRAAQRALSRSVHPSELAQANEQGRELVIQIQALDGRAREGGPSARSEEQRARDQADLERVDRLLDEISNRTREMLDRLEISHLRSSIPLLCAQHPDEVRGLIDVLLDGDLGDDKNLRTLEFLITMLSTEERNGRRVLAQEPSEISPRLREVSEQQVAEEDGEAPAAERTFGDALTRLDAEQDVGATRDRVRRYKEGLGSHILHPRILRAAVSYNVAMWNRVAVLIEGSRSIDRLADDLLALGREAGSGAPANRASPPSDPAGILGSATFTRIVSAFRARLAGDAISDEPAWQVVASFETDGLDPVEVEAFDTQDEDEITGLVREAVVLGLTIRHSKQVAEPLRAMQIDPELLATRCVDELVREMSAAARKLFASSRYDDAFRLSEIKTRNLAAITTSQGREATGPAPGSGAARSGEERPSALGEGLRAILRFDWGLPVGQVWALVFLLAVALVTAFLWSPGTEVTVFSRQQLSRISPFLESGFRRVQDGETQFVGRLGRGWDYLGSAERLRVTREIGVAFEASGVESVVLEDRWKRIQARYDDEPILVAPLTSAPPGGSP